MPLAAYVDSVALNTSTGSQTVSPGSLGFTPTGVMFSNNRLTADGAAIDVAWMFGAAASASDERYEAFESEDGSANADCGAVALNTGCMSGLLANFAVDFVGDFTSFNASPAGFTFNLSDAPAAARILNYVLLGGDVTAIETFVHNFGGASAGSDEVKTGLAGTPSCVIFFTATVPTASDTLAAGAANGTASVGWMCADGTQGSCQSRHTNSGVDGNTIHRQRTDKCITIFSTVAEVLEAHFVSMDANGYTVHCVNAHTANVRVYGVAIYGGTWTAGSFTSNTGTGTFDVPTTGVNPALVLLQTFGEVAGTSSVNGGRRSIGASDGTRQWALAYDDEDAAPTTVADQYLSRAHGLLKLTAGTPVVNDSWVVTSLGTEAFTLNHDVASGVAIQGIYLVGGDTPIPPVPGGGDLHPFAGRRSIIKLAPVRWG